MSKKKETEENQLKKDILYISLFITFLGFVLFIIGIYKLLYTTPQLAINSRYLQQFIDDGSLLVLLGLLLFGVGIYRLIFRKKILKDTIEIEENKIIK